MSSQQATETAEAEAPAAQPRPASLGRPQPKAEQERPRPPPEAPPEKGLRFLGTFAPAGALRHKLQRGLCALPVAVFDKTGEKLHGVAVVSNPSIGGATLQRLIEEKHEDLKGPFKEVPASMLTKEQKGAAALTISAQDNKELDKRGALTAFGADKLGGTELTPVSVSRGRGK